MGRHLAVPLVTIPLSFSPLGEDGPTAETTLEDRRSKRRYRHRNIFSSCPDADARHSRERRSIANARRRFTLVAVRCSTLPQQTWDLTKSCDATMDWILTVSDKWNTARAFAFTTPTACLALSISDYRPGGS
jgi:hypothetical protein